MMNNNNIKCDQVGWSLELPTLVVFCEENTSPTWDPSPPIFMFLIQFEPFDSEAHCPSHPTPNKNKVIRRNVQEIVLF